MGHPETGREAGTGEPRPGDGRADVPPPGQPETLETRIRRHLAAASRACLLLAPAEAAAGAAPAGEDPAGGEPADAAAALRWLADCSPALAADAQAAMDAGLYRLAWQLAMSLSPVQAHYFPFTDWAALSDIAVAAAGKTADPAALADALDNRGRYLFRRRLLPQARESHARALELRQSAGDRRGACRSLNALGLVCLRERDLAQAADRFAGAARTAADAGDERFAAMARMNFAEALLDAGRNSEALEILLPLPGLFASWHDDAYEGNAWWLLSWARREAGDPAAALAAIGTALRIAGGTANPAQRAHWLAEAARVHLAIGDAGQAAACAREAAEMQRGLGDESREAAALGVTGEAALAAGDAGQAAALQREAASAHQRLGDRWQEAVAAALGADAEEALGHADAARELRARALTLAGPFPDGPARRLCAGLRSRIEAR